MTFVKVFTVTASLIAMRSDERILNIPILGNIYICFCIVLFRMLSFVNTITL
jgi:hypothetical protein